MTAAWYPGQVATPHSEFIGDLSPDRIGALSRARFGFPAERAVLTLLREGLSNADIARVRGASQHTVANQVAAILRKTEAKSRRELAARPEPDDPA